MKGTEGRIRIRIRHGSSLYFNGLSHYIKIYFFCQHFHAMIPVPYCDSRERGANPWTGYQSTAILQSRRDDATPQKNPSSWPKPGWAHRPSVVILAENDTQIYRVNRISLCCHIKTPWLLSWAVEDHRRFRTAPRSSFESRRFASSLRKNYSLFNFLSFWLIQKRLILRVGMFCELGELSL
jgi:hypothetical protein